MEIIKLLKHSPRPMTTKEIELHLSNQRSRRSIERELQKMVKRGIIKRTKFNTTGYKLCTLEDLRIIVSQRGQ